MSDHVGSDGPRVGVAGCTELGEHDVLQDGQCQRQLPLLTLRKIVGVTYVARAIGLSVLVLLTDVYRRRMLQCVPQLTQEAVGQLHSQLGVAGEVGHKLDDLFHDHGFVICELLALDLGHGHVLQGLEVCSHRTVSTSGA